MPRAGLLGANHTVTTPSPTATRRLTKADLDVLLTRVGHLLLDHGVGTATIALPDLGVTATLANRRLRVKRIKTPPVLPAVVEDEPQLSLSRVCARPGCHNAFDTLTGHFGGGREAKAYCCHECQQASYRLRAKAAKEASCRTI